MTGGGRMLLFNGVNHLGATQKAEKLKKPLVFGLFMRPVPVQVEDFRRKNSPGCL